MQAPNTRNGFLCLRGRPSFRLAMLAAVGLLLCCANGCARNRRPLSVPLSTPPPEVVTPELEAPSYWPVSHSGMRITSRFGEIRSGGRVHKGLDIAVPRGTPIMAAACGVASFTGTQGGYGKMVIVDHRNGYETVYAHLDKIFAHQGNPVQRGATIGLAGATGNATGPHLHYEVRKYGKTVCPEAYLPPGRTAQAVHP